MRQASQQKKWALRKQHKVDLCKRPTQPAFRRRSTARITRCVSRRLSPVLDVRSHILSTSRPLRLAHAGITFEGHASLQDYGGERRKVI